MNRVPAIGVVPLEVPNGAAAKLEELVPILAMLLRARSELAANAERIAGELGLVGFVSAHRGPLQVSARLIMGDLVTAYWRVVRDGLEIRPLSENMEVRVWRK